MSMICSMCLVRAQEAHHPAMCVWNIATGISTVKISELPAPEKRVPRLIYESREVRIPHHYVRRCRVCGKSDNPSWCCRKEKNFKKCAIPRIHVHEQELIDRARMEIQYKREEILDDGWLGD